MSVIIPAAGTPALLRACLRSLARCVPPAIPFETIVVLDGAGEGAGPLDAGVEASGLRVVRPAVTLGLAGACNAARRLARGEYLVLLHDDAEVEPGWLEVLVETADLHPEAGAVGGKVLHPDGSLQNAGMVLWRDGTTSPPWAGEPAPPPGAFDRPRAVDYCGTSSLLVRAASWDAVDGCDERFFPAYYVDVDLCMALRRRRQIVLYEPRSRIRHHRGASGDRRFREFITRRNRELFVAKWQQDLQDYEPPAPASPAAVERALARAEERAAQLIARPGGVGAAPSQAGPPPSRWSGAGRRPAAEPDPAPAVLAARDRRFLDLGLALHRAYAAHLAAALDEALADRAACRRELDGERRRAEALVREVAEVPELRARAAALAAIERGRWWRLYLRVLPVLRACLRKRRP